MNDRSLESLTRRTNEGNRDAREALGSALEPYLARVVRRALTKGRPDSEVARRVHATAQRLNPDAQALPPADLTRQVADVLGQVLVNRAWGGGTDCFDPHGHRDGLIVLARRDPSASTS